MGFRWHGHIFLLYVDAEDETALEVQSDSEDDSGPENHGTISHRSVKNGMLHGIFVLHMAMDMCMPWYIIMRCVL